MLRFIGDALRQPWFLAWTRFVLKVLLAYLALWWVVVVVLGWLVGPLANRAV